MSGETKETNRTVKETEKVSGSNVNQLEKKEQRIFCDVCKVQCTSEYNFKEHIAGRKHLKHLKLSPCLPQQKEKRKTSRKKNPTKATSDCSPNLHDKDKSQNIQDSYSSTESTETMNNSNKYNQNIRYNNPHFGHRYTRPNSKYNYSNSYRSANNYNRNFYQSYSDWNSHSNSAKRPTAQSHNYNYGSKRHFYPQYGHDASRANEFSSGNKYSYVNAFSDYNESSNSDRFLQNFEHENDGRHEAESFSSINPFKQYFAEEAASLAKSSEETLSAESTTVNTAESSVSSKYSNSYKKHLNSNTSKIVGKKIRSRSLSSSESDKKGKEKTDQTESEEQRIQEWTNSLLETNHNQITRLINPSNHKEKAAVNHLITKFSKSKRKEILTRTLSTNSLELIDDDRDANSETGVTNVEEEEIAVVLDSKIINLNLEQNITNLSTSYVDKMNNSKHDKANQGQNNSKIVKSSRSPINKNSKTYSKNSEGIKDDSFVSNKSSPNNSSLDKYNEKYVKRKSANSDVKAKKKQKTTSFQNLNASNTTDSADLNIDDSRKEIQGNFSFMETSVQDPLLSDTNKERAGTIGLLPDPLDSISSEKNPEQNLVLHPNVSVDTLIELFASGSVKVKEEFNDPLMDALKDMNEDELINACSNNSLINADEETIVTANLSNKKNSKDKSLLEAPLDTVLTNKSCLNPVILGSAAMEASADETCAINENVCSPSMVHQTEAAAPVFSTSDKSEIPPTSPICGEIIGHSLLKINELKPKLEMPPYLNKLIKQLQNITSEEEKVKQDLTSAKLKINEYTSLVEEWKRKKKLLHGQEEDLRKQRNNIINLMQNAIKTDNDDEKESPPLQKEDTLDDHVASSKKRELENTAKVVDTFETSVTSPPIIENQQKQKKSGSSPQSPESDEITILPSPQKLQPLEIVICDDEENIPSGSQAEKPWHEMDANVSSNKRLSTYDLKNVKAHTTVVNCLVVFEDYLYTCSNEYTAKRFSLKDSSCSMTYTHTAKNVTEIVVEKMQNEALVFTSCSSKIISLFIASTGTKIKSFFPPCSVTSICKGWGKFYSGLANGAVNMYNWKYEEYEIVKTDHPVSCIATAHQGRLHVLVILSSEGNISIRDAETGLLIRYVKIFIKHPSIMCLHNDLAYLSSSDKVLTILDIMSGRIEKRIYMSCQTTGLAVYDDYIFTIYYNGVINCYNKDTSSDKRIFYGVGKGSVTCVHVHQNWVFTGNRKGYISSFHFDPSSSITCEFSKCDAVYGLKEDLDYHVERDHLLKKKNWPQCPWRRCGFTFPENANTVDKMNHLKSHIYEMNCLASNV